VVKDLRDRLVHQNARTTVFPTADGIQFQIHDHFRSLVIEEPLLLPNGIASFEFVAASVAALVHQVLEKAGLSIAERLQLVLDPTNGWSRHQGLAVIGCWTDALIDSLSCSDVPVTAFGDPSA
jgi:hypothetical protein